MAAKSLLRLSGRVVAGLTVAFALTLLLSACGDKSAAPSAPAAQQKPAAAKAKKGPDLPSLEPPEISVFDEKAFDAKLFRDPFKPFIRVVPKDKSGQAKKVVVPQTPLQRFALEELKLVGVLWYTERPPEALIEDPKGKGYKVRAGALVGNRGGKIVKITPDTVVLEEIVTDALGEETANSITIKLHNIENEVNQ